MINGGLCGLRTCCLRFPYFPNKPLFRAARVSFSCPRRLFATASAVSRAKKDEVIVVSGPTGYGKSRFSLELAKRLNGEIISEDSVEAQPDAGNGIFTKMGVGGQVENFTAFYQNFKRHLGISEFQFRSVNY